MQLAAIYSIGGISGYCACCYTGNLAVCSNSYFAQLSAFSGDLAVVAACIAYIQLTVTQCGIFIEYAIFQNYVADFAFGCGYFAVFIYVEFIVCCVEIAGAVYKERHDSIFCHSAYGQVVFGVQCISLNGVYINVFVQLNLNLSAVMAYADVLVAAEINKITGFYIGCFGYNTVGSQVPALVGNFAYFVQLAYVNSIIIINACCYAADFTGIVDTNNTIDLGAAIQHNYRCLAIGDACNTCSQGYTGLSVNYTGNIVQFTGKVNFYIVAIVANSNILMIAGILFTAEINGCFRCYLICCAAFSGKLPAFISICSCIPQLAYVYSISIFSTCCYIDNLTVSVSSAYGYCISSVSYAAGTQSNTAFTGNFGIMTENNSVINSCFGYFISRAENNVILTAYLVIITDNLVAVCGNFIFNTDCSNIRCIGNSVLITVNKVILCSLSFSTGYFILYAGQLGVFSVISLVAAADCHYRTTCIFAGLHSFNCFLLCFSNRKLIPAIIININAFNRVGNFVAGTPD